MRFEARTVERMEPKSQEERIAELEALIERMQADLALARKALQADEEAKRAKSGNGA